MKKIFLTSASILYFMVAVWSQPVTAPGNPLLNDPSVRAGQLANGLTFYIKQNVKSEKRADFHLFANAGGIDEPLLHADLAHFWEFRALNGIQNFPGKGIIDYMERIGARYGENINTGTDVEYSYFTLNNISIVRQGIIDTALLMLHDYSHFIVGDPAVIVVGDFNPDEMVQHIISTFSDIPKPVAPLSKEAYPFPRDKEPLVDIIIDSEISYTSVSVLYKRPALPLEMNNLGMAYILDMMKSISSAMLNDRLMEISQKSDAPFLGASAGFSSLSRSMDVFSMGAVSKDGAGMTAFHVLLQELERVERYGFTESELERAKANLIRKLEQKAATASDRTNSEFIGEYMAHLMNNKPYMAPEYEWEVAKGYAPFIRLPQLNELIKETIKEENIVILFSAPSKTGIAVPEEKDFTAALKSAKKLRLEPYEEEISSEPLMNFDLKGGQIISEEEGLFGSIVWVLDNGVQMILKPADYKKDEVIFTAFKQGGFSILPTEDLPSAQIGLPAFLHVSGVSDYSYMDLNKKLTGTIASVSPYLSTYEAGFRGTASPKDFEIMLQLLYLRMTASRFVESEFAPVMAQLNTIVPNLSKQPDYLLKKEWGRALYQNNQRRSVVDEESLEKIDFGAMERIYRQLLGSADGLTIVMTGDVVPDDIKPLVEKYIGSLPVKGRSPVWKDEGIYLPKGSIDHSFHAAMETAKATVQLTYHGEMPYTLENNVKMQFLAQVMDLLCTETIFEEEGSACEVRICADLENKPAELFQLQIIFDAAPERVAKMAALARKILINIALEGPTEEQIQKIIDIMIERFQENKIRNDFWLSLLLQYYRDRIDVFSSYEQIIKGMTIYSVKEMAEKSLSQNFVELIMIPQ